MNSYGVDLHSICFHEQSSFCGWSTNNHCLVEGVFLQRLVAFSIIEMKINRRRAALVKSLPVEKSNRVQKRCSVVKFIIQSFKKKVSELEREEQLDRHLTWFGSLRHSLEEGVHS